MRGLIGFVAGAITGAYVAQNYKLPPIEEVLRERLEKLKAMFPPKD